MSLRTDLDAWMNCVRGNPVPGEERAQVYFICETELRQLNALVQANSAKARRARAASLKRQSQPAGPDLTKTD